MLVRRLLVQENCVGVKQLLQEDKTGKEEHHKWNMNVMQVD